MASGSVWLEAVWLGLSAVTLKTGRPNQSGMGYAEGRLKSGIEGEQEASSQRLM